MKKSSYFERIEDGKGGFKFVEEKGYIEYVNSVNPIRSVAVAFSKEGTGKNTQWKATHLRSGLLIVRGYKTQEECRQEVHRLLNSIFRCEDDRKLQPIMDQLTEHLIQITEKQFK